MAEFKIPWLRFALVLIPVIALNVFLVYKVIPKKKPERIESKPLPVGDLPPQLPPEPQKPVRQNKVVPWDYGRTLALPPNLASRFAGDGKNKRVKSGIVIDLNTRFVSRSAA